MPDDAAFMARALDLATRGRRTVSPNPMVGCVLVRDDRVVGEGWHVRPGESHAEIIALQQAGEQAAGATAYVSLEPCDHAGRTGPCTQALINAGVTRVVAAIADPHPVAAGGAETLRGAGIDVHLGLLEDQAARLNEVFLHGVVTQRPFVIAKVATSLDGRIAAADGTSQWLTGEAARLRVHELRADVDAVLVGSGTVLADNPRLTSRLEQTPGEKQPLRVVLDRRGRITSEYLVMDGSAETLIARDNLVHTLDALWDRDIRSVLVEGGATILHAFLAAELVDRLHVHVAPLLLGDRGRPLLAGPWAQTLSDAPRFRLDEIEQLDDDVLLTLSPQKPAAARTA